ncbi:MAG: hypothetical protein WAW27_09360, partial [Chitinophagaceae bacterium]
MEESVNSGKSELGNLSFRDLFYKYVRFLPLFVLSVAFALLGAYMYLRYTIPIYSVGGSMVIKSDQGNSRGDKLEDLFGNNKSLNIQSEMEILKSRPLMQRVVDSLNLQFSYFVKGKIKKVNIYRQGPFIVNALRINDSSRSFSIKIRFSNNRNFRIDGLEKIYTFGQLITIPYGVIKLEQNFGVPSSNEYEIIWQPTASAARAYAGAIQVIPKSPGTGILSISMRTPNSLLGADIINTLMKEYSDYSIEQKKQSSDQTLVFIDDRLTTYGNKLD